MSTDEPDRRAQSWQHLLADDPGGAAGLRLGVAAALAIHAAVFAVTFPTKAQAPPPPPEEVLIPYPLTELAPPPERPPESLLIEPPITRPQGPPVVSAPPEETLVSSTIEEQPPPSGPVVPVIVSPPAAPPPSPPNPELTEVRVHVHVDPPVVLDRVEPRYTEPARRTGIQGVVVLDLLIGTSGAVESISVLKRLPLGLTESAVDAVTQWRFEPCVYDGHPVSVRYVLTVRFTLD
ncbi:MAG: energy transducer TonB [Thermoanaerobaculales bacterium]|jgi:protein TonB|nr:energy transducer TonB [Thermoanaerobaculales bacterium]